MKKLIVVILIMTGFFSECFCQDRLNYILTDHYQVDPSGVYLNVYQESNNLLFRIMKGDNIHDQMAFTNIDVVDNCDFKQVSFLEAQEATTLVLKLGIRGSTFGANQHLIIWNDGEYWNLSKVSFYRSFLIDIDKDNLMEFQEFDSREHHLYKFSAGILTLYQPAK